MNGFRRFLVVFLTLFLVVGAEGLSAQRGLGGGGLGLYGFGPRLGENVALALELRGELGLSGEQVAALEDLGAGILLDVEPIEMEIEALRSQILTGGVTDRDGLLQLQSLLADYDVIADPYRSGIASILTVDQHLTLQAAMFDTRPYLGQPYLGQGALGVGVGYGRGIAYGRGGGYGFGYGARPAYGRGAAVGFRGNMALGVRGGVGMGAGRAGRGFRRVSSPRGRWYRR